MAQYTTSEESMAQGAAKVETATTQIQGVLQKLQGEVDSLQGGWRGQGANSFMQVHEAFTQQASKINNALRNMHEALTSNRQTYSTQESDQSSTFQSMVGNING